MQQIELFERQLAIAKKCALPVAIHTRDAEDDTAHLTLHLEIQLPEPLPDVKPEGGQGGGFDATVNDWGEEIDIAVPV